MKYTINKQLNKYFHRVKITTLEQLKMKLDTDVDKTIQRYLKELNGLSSYSHNGKYHTLNSIIQFNNDGLWNYHEVYFSVYGTLIDTIEHFVTASEAGYCSESLHNLLKINVNDALLKLVTHNRITREKIENRYYYFSNVPQKMKQQLLLCRSITEKNFGKKLTMNHLNSTELKQGFALFFNQLDEKQKRLFAGLESARLGYGGDKIISKTYGVDAHSVSKGRNEILSGYFEKERIRKIGGGQIPLKKKS